MSRRSIGAPPRRVVWRSYPGGRGVLTDVTHGRKVSSAMTWFAIGTDGVRRSTSWLGLVAVCLALASPAAGQGGANIGGVVTDDTDAALPGVTITLVNTNNGATQVLVSGPEGNYRAVNLQPGPYSITAELAGFSTNKRAVTLLVGANTTVNVKLSVATLSENVIVSGESPLVEVAKAQPSSVIVGEQLAVLPVLDRNFLVLAQLLPGAAPLTRRK